MASDMAADHARDYRVKGLMDEAARALRALLNDDEAVGRLGERDRASVYRAWMLLDGESRHVVAVWD